MKQPGQEVSTWGQPFSTNKKGYLWFEKGSMGVTNKHLARLLGINKWDSVSILGALKASGNPFGSAEPRSGFLVLAENKQAVQFMYIELYITHRFKQMMYV